VSCNKIMMIFCYSLVTVYTFIHVCIILSFAESGGDRRCTLVGFD